jgi:hypothetical protein
MAEDVKDTTSGARELEGERYPPISDAVFARLVPILQAGNLEPAREAAEQLDAMARYSLQAVELRDRPSRQRPALRKYRRRPSDPPRERLIRARGAPRNREMRQLFANFIGFWLDRKHAAPGVSFDQWAEEYTGPFVRFAMAFCAELASMLSRLKDAGPHEAAFLETLSDAADYPARIRSWLDALSLKPKRPKKPKKLRKPKPRKPKPRIRSM